MFHNANIIKSVLCCEMFAWVCFFLGGAEFFDYLCILYDADTDR